MKKKDLIEKFTQAKILVIGDIMLDKYIFGSVERISPEAPIPVVLAKNEKLVPGGAANVANNIKSLGGTPELIGILGDDPAGAALLHELKESGISTKSVIVSDSVKTIQKIRILSSNQQLLRLDYEENKSTCEEELCMNIKKEVPGCSTIIISDYAKGVITERVIGCLKEEADKHQKKIIIDPKPAHKLLYSGAFLITPNQKEAEGLAGMKISNEASVHDIGSRLMAELDSNVLITRGEKGMMLFSGKDTISLPTQAKDVFDVSGAGDTVVAALALAISAGATPFEASELANHAAGIVVGKLGTATATPSELIRAFEHETKKVKKIEELKASLASAQSLGKKVVFTNGCFDILHSGHVSLLRQAKSFGDILVVGINSDESVRKLKGPKRPIVSENERAELLSALECVDYVTIFADADPCRIISELRPDIHVKGGDYNPDDYVKMPESKIVRSYGGTVKIVKLVDGKSTTSIIDKVLARQK